MNRIREFFASLRVFNRIRVIEEISVFLDNERNRDADRICMLEAFIASREPCAQCGHHKYKQKTIHRSAH